MKDTRTVLDNVRMMIPGDAKLLVMHLDNNGRLRCAQANMTQKDVQDFGNALIASALSEKLVRR
jgi:hypothetical protein